MALQALETFPIYGLGIEPAWRMLLSIAELNVSHAIYLVEALSLEIVV